MILYARNFIPSWAGAIAIDLLPGVLVLIVAITQGLIREGREGAAIEDTMTIAELRAALHAARDVDRAYFASPPPSPSGPAGAAPPDPVPPSAPPSAEPVSSPLASETDAGDKPSS